MQKQGSSFTEIAKSIGVHKSAISRKLQQNSDQRSGAYQVDLAQKKYYQRQANKPKSIRLTQEIRDFITQWIKQDYSPEQIISYSKIYYILCVSLKRIINLFGKKKRKDLVI